MRVRGSDDSMSQSSRDQTRRESLASYTRRVVTDGSNAILAAAIKIDIERRKNSTADGHTHIAMLIKLPDCNKRFLSVRSHLYGR